MHILLTNDDGIYAEGIYALYQELKKIAKVSVIAPDSEKSSVGHGITLAHPIWFKKINRKGRFFGYAISGTPADCVKFATSVLLKRKPDMVVSGINQFKFPVSNILRLTWLSTSAILRYSHPDRTHNSILF